MGIRRVRAQMVGLVLAGVIVSLLPALRSDALMVAFNGYIYYSAGSGKSSEIYALGPDGQGAVRLTKNKFDDTSPSTQNNGGNIWFATQRPDESAIYRIDSNGSNESLLIGGPETYRDPMVSADGSKIVFSQTPSEFSAFEDSEILIMGTDPANPIPVPTALTNNGNLIEDTEPVFNPAGTKIAWTQPSDDGSTIHTMDVNGANQTFLTNGESPRYAPHGNSIVFENGGDIWTVTTAGTALQNLTLSPSVVEADPVYSPDGTQIVYSVLKGKGAKGDLWAMNQNGESQHRLFKSGSSETPSFWGKALCDGFNATTIGTSDEDFLLGTPGNDVIVTYAGNDQVSPSSGNDRVCGGLGNDELGGGPGEDELYGEDGGDTLFDDSVDPDVLDGGRNKKKKDTCSFWDELDELNDCEKAIFLEGGT